MKAHLAGRFGVLALTGVLAVSAGGSAAAHPDGGMVAGWPPPTNSFFASNLPVRSSAAPTFAYVAGKSRITNASGLPATICCASES